MKGTVGRKITLSLALQGMDTLFCVPGERYPGLTDALTRSYTFPAAPDPQMPRMRIWPDAHEIGIEAALEEAFAPGEPQARVSPVEMSASPSRAERSA